MKTRQEQNSDDTDIDPDFKAGLFMILDREMDCYKKELKNTENNEVEKFNSLSLNTS